MELYIARDRDGRLFLYNYLPIKDEKSGIFKLNGEFRGSNICFDIFNIDSKLFPEITYENSPKQVELVFSKINNKNDIIMKVIGILLILILMIIPINLIITLIKLLTN
jgi:hypothetical protein